VFHALCDDLIGEAFRHTDLLDMKQQPDLLDMEQQRSAAITVVTHFFEICEIFKSATEATPV
jgi:hypothetical protein